VAVVIPLKLVYTPVDATVTAIRNYQVPSTKKLPGAGRERKHRAKNDVEPRVHWTLNTTHQFIIIATSMIS
jgi:hypothetical protein